MRSSAKTWPGVSPAGTPRAERFYGRASEEMIGQSMQAFLPDETALQLESCTSSRWRASGWTASTPGTCGPTASTSPSR